jgi:hypothetical protein
VNPRSRPLLPALVAAALVLISLASTDVVENQHDMECVAVV